MAREIHLTWFPLYVTDFLNSRKVRVMTPEAVGIYILLLCHQWDGGPLPEDTVVLSNLANGAHPDDVLAVLEQCFSKRSDGWVNERLEQVRGEQESQHHRRASAGRAGGIAKRNGRTSNKIEDLSNAVAMPEPRLTIAVATEQNRTEQETTLGASGDAPDVDGALKLTVKYPAKPKQAGQLYEYPEDFERAWTAFPKREGPNPKQGAYQAWRARAIRGASPDELANAAGHYAAHVRATGKERTPYVQQAATFYGPSEPWREFIEAQPVGTNGNGQHWTETL